MNLDARVPAGPLAEKWSRAKFDLKLVNPANKRKYKVIVVGSGLYTIYRERRRRVVKPIKAQVH